MRWSMCWKAAKQDIGVKYAAGLYLRFVVVVLLASFPELAASSGGLSGQERCAPSGDGQSTSCAGTRSSSNSLDSILDNLDAISDDMRSSRLTLQALEKVRGGLTNGERILLPSGARQHLALGNPAVNDVSFSAKHAPLTAKHGQHIHLRTLAPNLEARHMAFLQLKKAASSTRAGSGVLLIMVDSSSRLAVYSMEGEALLEDFDLGHDPGVEIDFLALSPSQENHFVLTADSSGNIRLHNLKIVARRERKERDADDDDDMMRPELPPSVARKAPHRKQQLVVNANFSASFALPVSRNDSGEGETRYRLTAVMPFERSSNTYIVTGDASGGIAVFQRNGTFSGRVRATTDPGGIRGFLRGQSQSIIFFSAHHFGFFSTFQIDVQFQPCSGWNSPLVDMVLDPQAPSSRMILALADGDILVYSTMHGKSRACDLHMKFPKVSNVPFKLSAFRGHVAGLMSATPDGSPQDHIFAREVFFFSVGAMEEGYGITRSNAVVLQLDFKPKQPADIIVQASPAGSGERSRGQLAVRMTGEKGIELYDVVLKQPPAPTVAASASEDSGWFSWFPRFGVFGIVLVGVLIWNVWKYSGWGNGDLGDLNDAELEAKIKELAKEGGFEGAMDGGGGSFSSSGPSSSSHNASGASSFVGSFDYDDD